ncbi:MAG: lysozyme inhibitor LprI family protein [Pseudomonadota bacterium]
MQRSVLAVMAATGIAAMAAPETSEAQSFDCAKAATAIEKQICNDPNLGLMDSELGSVYGALRSSLAGESQAELRASERAWVQERNACDPQSDCATQAYAQRLHALSKKYGVFTGWSGTFQSWADVQFSITDTDGSSYEIAVSGAGQNWQCSGTFAASQSADGSTLTVSGDSGDVAIETAGTGLWVPAGIDAIAESKGFCGASAPSLSGFYVRSSSADTPDARFDRAPFVHPQIIREFATGLSDTGDQVVAINLTDSQSSNRFAGEFTVAPDLKGGAPIVTMSDGDEQFSYQFIGAMENGIQVIKTTQSSSDGTGVFPTLMLLSFRQDHGITVNSAASEIAQGAARRLLFKHGELLVLSDRWQGELKVDGNRIFIGANESPLPNSGDDFSGWLTYDAGDTAAQ